RREGDLALRRQLTPAAGASASLSQLGRRTPRGERLDVQRRQQRELLEERAHLPPPRVGALRGAGRGPELLEEVARILDRRARLAENVGRDARVVEKRARGVELLREEAQVPPLRPGAERRAERAAFAVRLCERPEAKRLANEVVRDRLVREEELRVEPRLHG